MQYKHVFALAFLANMLCGCVKAVNNSQAVNGQEVAPEHSLNLYLKAKDAIRSGEYSEAVPLLETLTKDSSFYEISCYNLAMIYLRGTQQYQDLEKGKTYLLLAANGLKDNEYKRTEREARGYDGLPSAKYELALSFLFGGYGIDKNGRRGIQLLDTLSQSCFAGWKDSEIYDDEGDFLGTKAKIMLASFYSNGRFGLPQNQRKGAQLWNEALAFTGKHYMEEKELLLIIGKEYSNNSNPFYRSISDWLLKDAQEDSPVTQFLLALCYKYGNGVPKNVAKSNHIIQNVHISQDLSDAIYPLWLYISGGNP